jgi:hypothetical protein
MEAITIPHIHIPSIDIGGICLPGIGVPDGGKKGLIWPKGLKESIKAIYDPTKQGMTNYDVIEAYVEDFTYWTLDNTGITSTPKKIVIPAGTELKYVIAFRGFNSFTAGFDIKYTGNAVITYRYNKEDGTVGTIAIDKSGIYHLPASVRAQKSFGFYCNPQTVTEEATIEQLPTSILKDLSGNGNHAYLYGGKGKLNSGMGVYQQDFTNTRNATTVSSDGFEVAKKGGTYLARISIGYWNNKECKLLFETNNTTNLYFIRYRKANNDIVATVRLYNGENIIPAQDDLTDVSEVIFEGIVGDNEYIRVTEISDYPNQLCYNGSMYAVCYGFPILTDYTVIADRTWFEIGANSCFASKRLVRDGFDDIAGAFAIEYRQKYCNNFGAATGISFEANKQEVIVQTKAKYMDTNLNIGDGDDSDILIIGANNNRADAPREPYIGCHGKIIIADRSFTKDEITWLKDKFFTIDIPTPAYDFDFSKLKSGENTFTDKYGNELSLHNFAWSGMSGKGGYNEDFTNWTNKGRGVLDIKPNSFTVTNVNVSNAVLIEKRDYNVRNNIVLDVKGIINESIYVGAFDKDKIIIEKDGIYKIDVSSFSSGTYGIGFIDFTGDCNITITQLPLYPNALVFDGIDDYCKLSKMTIKTVILDFVNLELNRQIYDNRDKPNNHYDFSIYPEADTIAYEARNSDGKTYIDGELNTTIKTNDLLEVRCTVCASNNSAKETEQYISKDSLLNNFYGKMALYRITGFTEVLTPDQVWKWYQKNKPKGGDK